MTSLRQRIELPESALADAAAWYPANHIPKAFQGLPKIHLDLVAELCCGDWRRCVLNDDGSVSVHNRRMW